MTHMVHTGVKYLERSCEEILKQMAELSFLKKLEGTQLLTK
jgi:hypothetical protein